MGYGSCSFVAARLYAFCIRKPRDSRVAQKKTFRGFGYVRSPEIYKIRKYNMFLTQLSLRIFAI